MAPLIAFGSSLSSCHIVLIWYTHTFIGLLNHRVAFDYKLLIFTGNIHISHYLTILWEMKIMVLYYTLSE